MLLILSGILDDFLGEGRNDATFNGRMGTGVFDFWVNTERGIRRRIHVENAQCEIDGGFENPSSVVILEAKNVVHSDFHVRQLIIRIVSGRNGSENRCGWCFRYIPI